MKYALRSLCRDRGLAIAVTLTLALAIGGNAAIFSVVNGVLLKPLNVPAPDRLVVISEQTAVRPDMGVSYPDYLDWRSRQTSFDDMAASLIIGGVLTGGGDAERVFGRAVTRSFFSTLRAPFHLGRGFNADEDRPGGTPAAVLSYALWQRRYGADPALVGRTVTYNDEVYTVVGVLTAGFDLYGRNNANNDFFVPLGPLTTADYMRQRERHPARVVGRMKAGVSIERATADLSAIAGALATQYPGSNTGVAVRVRSLLDDYVGDVRVTLTALMAAAALVLAVACANIANLLLARAAARRRDVAVRLALGASRLRVVADSCLESVLLSVAGGALGLFVASIATDGLRSLSPDVLPRLADVALEWRVIAFTAAVSVAAGLALGAAPAFVASGADLRRSLGDGGRSSTSGGRRLREALVVAQVALSIALLVGAGLLARSFAALLLTDPGYKPTGVVTMRVRLPDGRYRQRERVVAMLDETLRRVTSLPGVESAALTTGVPLGRANEERYLVEGQPPPPHDRVPVALTQWVSADYHRTFAIDLLGGRLFTAADREGRQDVAIVDEEFERRMFPAGPSRPALGRRVHLAGEPGRWRTIVGVVRHVRHASLDEQPRVEVYAPYLQMDPSWQLEIGRAMDVAVRSSRDAASVVAGVRQAVQGIDPDIPLSHVRAMDEALSDSLTPRVLNAGLLGLFAVVALLMCVVGLYAVMSYAVTQRTREIGVRVALGAAPPQILRLLLGASARIVAIGLVLGLGIAIASGRLLQGMLYAVDARDPMTFALAALLLTVVAGLAAYLPARRATELSPVVALSRE